MRLHLEVISGRRTRQTDDCCSNRRLPHSAGFSTLSAASAYWASSRILWQRLPSHAHSILERVGSAQQHIIFWDCLGGLLTGTRRLWIALLPALSRSAAEGSPPRSHCE